MRKNLYLEHDDYSEGSLELSEDIEEIEEDEWEGDDDSERELYLDDPAMMYDEDYYE